MDRGRATVIVRIPPFYERTSWRRFFAGVIIGVLIGWFFFIYQYGQVYEGLMMRISKQETVIDNQQKRIDCPCERANEIK